ncbi:hypothetical protein llap_22397 [Limosa lapponica baueri]|uniref:Uncharacterized protein n=1 Tax=Limosa lapponica baueri TaxID=1758121 RepID=A0A2I0T0H9_LIMLA|nr:hypothetical protein llap_22397 [Limosa lapponica baueri]
MRHQAEPGDVISFDVPRSPTWHPCCQPLPEGQGRVDGGGGHQWIRLLALLVLVGGQRTLAGSSAQDLQKTEEHPSVYFGTQEYGTTSRRLQEHHQQSWSSCTTSV